MILKELTNEELIKEWKAYDEMIHKIECYSVKDVQILHNLSVEIDKRGIILE